jgi:hypothetical protein
MVSGQTMGEKERPIAAAGEFNAPPDYGLRLNPL